jgi:hypothetical protein
LIQGDTRATMKLLQVGSTFVHIIGRCVMVSNVKKELHSAVTWSLGVAAKLVGRKLKSGVHGGLTLG